MQMTAGLFRRLAAALFVRVTEREGIEHKM